MNAPPVRGLSTTGGFEFIIQDRTGSAPIETLIENAQKFIAAANKNPALQRVFTQFTANTPQFEIRVNRNQAKTLNVDINQIFGALQTYLGSQYVNNFVQGQRQYRVYVQADGVFRSHPDDIGKLYVRSKSGTIEFFAKYTQGETSDDEVFVEWAGNYQHYLALHQQIKSKLRDVA